jgi:hypothetical protein
MTKSTILGHFFGIFGIFREGKGFPDGKTKKQIIHSTFCILIKPENFGLVNFF